MATASDVPLLQGADDPKRITISMGSAGERVFKLENQEVVLLGGNYVIKAQPYFPPRDVVLADALEMSQGAKAMLYKPPAAADGSQRVVRPCVRLGCMWEGSMPDKAGPIDPTWAGAHMQETVTSQSASGHCCCCTTPSYITNPDHPMTTVCPWWVCCCFCIEPVRTHGDNPWAAFAVGTDQGNPASMNVGNVSMRLNNNDLSWGLGTLVWVTQVHNYASRFYQCHSNPVDRKALFDPYVQYIQYLGSKWEQHWNVVGIELLNEPVLGGLPNVYQFLSCRRHLFDFYGAVLETLGQNDPPFRSPLALEDGFGSLGSGSKFMKLLSMIPISSKAKKQLKEWGEKNQLILSMHWYPSGGTLGHLDKVTVPEYVAMGKKQSAELFANSPIWLSEYCELLPQDTANLLAQWTNAGSPCTTYWQYVDLEYTQTFGWYKYPPEVKQYGEPVDKLGILNEKAWAAYEPTVRDGTYWGGQICGSAGGQTGVLSKVK